jgi:hypothetical protein
MQILSHTPAWVFILFAGLLAFGLLQTRDRSVKKPVAYLLPVAMVALSLSGVQSGFGLKSVPLAAWFAGLLLTTLLVRRAFRQTAMSFVPQQNRFFISGSWVPLVVIMGIFFTRYALAVIQGRMGAPVGPGAAAGLSMLLGAFSGYFVARALALIATAQRGELTLEVQHPA